MPYLLKRSQAIDDRRPEINISKFSVGGGVAGLIVVVSIIGIGLLGLPPTRWFLGVSLVSGLVVALILRWTARDRG